MEPGCEAKIFINTFITLATGIEKRRKKDACERVIREQSTVKIRLVKFNHIGVPRSGKTTFLRRFKGEIENIMKAGKRKGEQPSTGVAEDGGQVLIKHTSSAGVVWSVLKDKGDEADMLNQLFYQLIYSTKTDHQHDTEATPTSAPASSTHSANTSTASASSTHFAAKTSTEETDDDPYLEEMLSMLEEALESKDWDEIKYHLEDLTWLVNTDTGGHSEFLDLQAALIQGPSFNFLYCSLENDLNKPFPVYFTNKDGQSTQKVSSTSTTEEVFFQSLASATCYCGSCFSTDDNATAPDHKFPEYSNSKAMFVATHFDRVTKEVFEAKDKLLRQKIKNTDFYNEKLVVFPSEDQLMINVDNMTGDQSEIDCIKKIVEKEIEKNFEPISIPASWLVLSLFLRRKHFGVISLKDCEEVGKKLKITPGDLQHALWFLHHCVGLLLYYPEVDELKDLVICNPLLIYESTSNLIKNASSFEKVGQKACKEFQEKAHISLQDVKKAMASSNSKITPEKLVKLLKYINILSLPYPDKEVFLMPSLLKSALTVDLAAPPSSESDPAPLMIRYDCGYVPLGLFPSLLANLLSQQLKDWEIIEEGLCKNRVQFYVGEDHDIVTLIAYPQYIEIAISRRQKFETSTGVLCAHIRSTFQSTLLSVTSSMNHEFNMGYKFGFECLNHPQRMHLCMLAHEAADEEANNSARNMRCFENPRKPEPIQLQPKHKVWFEEECILGQIYPLKCSKKLARSPSANQPKLPLSELYRTLLPVMNDWKQIGTLLDCDFAILTNIQRKERDDSACLMEMLAERQKIHDPPLTWELIVKAVITLNSYGAEKIKKQHLS